MSPLPNVMGNVTQWLCEYAEEYIIWAGAMIRHGLLANLADRRQVGKDRLAQFWYPMHISKVKGNTWQK